MVIFLFELAMFYLLCIFLMYIYNRVAKGKTHSYSKKETERIFKL